MFVTGLTDKGIVRRENQDSLIHGSLSEHSLYAAVFDGMGGAKAGKFAGEFASSAFAEAIEKAGEKALHKAPGEELRRILSSINAEMFQKAEGLVEYHGMGTTCCAALLFDGQGMIANIGDSRAYLFDGEACTQLTRDHSIVAALLESGEIDEETARNHPQRNIITRALGTDPQVEADLYPVDARGKRLILCSDGLHGYFSARELCDILSRSLSDEAACRTLVDEAKKRGGRDNISVIIIHCDKERA